MIDRNKVNLEVLSGLTKAISTTLKRTLRD